MTDTKPLTRYEQWQEYLRCSWCTVPEAACQEITQALVDAEASGDTSCVWHEVHLWHVRNVLPTWPSCEICGGRLEPRQDGKNLHELCRLRKEKGSPIKQINATMTCGCVNCQT